MKTFYKNYLLLGGSGFMGLNILKRLTDAKKSVSVYDILSNAAAEELLKNKNCHFFNRDFIHENDFDSILNNTDVIIHLINTTIPYESNRNIIYDIESNILPSIKLFESARRNNVKKIIFISSGGTVYGNRNDYFPIKENSEIEPICSYGIVKHAIENYLRLITKETDIKFIILRPSNPYGINFYSNDKQLGLINSVLYALKNNKVIEIWGDGRNIRDYVYIEDLADAIISSAENTDIKNCALNIGTGKGLSILEIIELIKSITGKKISVNFMEPRQIDVNFNVLDISEAKKIMDWEPKTTIREGIIKTWEWINNTC
jgi:UDP-glucose 4-epimerase